MSDVGGGRNAGSAADVSGGPNLFLRHDAPPPSEMERRMMSVMGAESGASDDPDEQEGLRGGDGLEGGARGETEGGSSSLLSKLPIELIDRIISHAILDDGSGSDEEGEDQVAGIDVVGDDVDVKEKTETEPDALVRRFKRRRLSQQASTSLCLVCRQFDQLARSKMYQKVNITSRKMRSFWNTIRGNERLASMVHDLTLESKIWTDVDENVIAGIFLAVRSYVKRVRVGANESTLLPYLFQGEQVSGSRRPSPPTTAITRTTTDEASVANDQQQSEEIDGEEQHKEEGEEEKPIPLQILHICWRDEVEYTNVQEERRRRIEESIQSSSSSSSSSDTFRLLFQHDSSPQLPPPPPELLLLRRKTCPHLSHLTIDLYSQDQLCQLFEGGGFFVRDVLPLLSFIRIELPYIVLQFKSQNRGDLVRGWPKDDWRIGSGRMIEEAIKDRQMQIAAAAASRRRNQSSSSTTAAAAAATANTIAAPATTASVTSSIDRSQQLLFEEAEPKKDDDEGSITMPFCPSNQLKTLTLRFLLNVHRNDMTLFKLLIPPEALEYSWSTRASITAQCLSSTMQMHLNRGLIVPSSHAVGGDDVDVTLNQSEKSGVSFPLAEFNKKKVDGYWRQKWAEANRDYVSSLPNSSRGSSSSINSSLNSTPGNPIDAMQRQDDGGDSTKVSLLLKWPNAVDAFYYFSAMI